MQTTVTIQKGENYEIRTRPSTNRNISKIISVSRPFNANALSKNSSLNHNSLQNVESAKFLFFSLAEDPNKASQPNISTKQSSTPRVHLIPHKPESIVSPNRVRSEKKCRILTISARSSQPHTCHLSVETKLKISQTKVTQLTKIIEEKDKEIQRLKSELVKNQGENLKTPTTSYQTPHNEIPKTLQNTRSTSTFKGESKKERRSSATVLNTYIPVNVRKIRKAIITRENLNCAKKEQELLEKDLSGWRANPAISNSPTNFENGSQIIKIQNFEDEKMHDNPLKEKLQDLKEKMKAKLSEAYAEIDKLRKFIQENIQSSLNNNVLAITDSDLL